MNALSQPMTHEELLRARRRRLWLYRIAVLSGVFLSPFAVTLTSQPVPQLGVSIVGLQPCPDTPNCVSSDFVAVIADTARQFQQEVPKLGPHSIMPLEVAGDAETSWKALESISHTEPGIRVVKSLPRYLHIERRTTIYGLIDDVEFQQGYTGTVFVRAAARLGYSDFGRNRRFVEHLRTKLKATASKQ